MAIDEDHGLQPEYTKEQLETVKNVKKCQNFYEILNVTKEASVSEIKQSYKKLALQLHPDKNKAPGSTEAFKAIGNAHSTLTNPEQRKIYDLYGINDPSNSYTRNHNYGNEYAQSNLPDIHTTTVVVIAAAVGIALGALFNWKSSKK